MHDDLGDAQGRLRPLEGAAGSPQLPGGPHTGHRAGRLFAALAGPILHDSLPHSFYAAREVAPGTVFLPCNIRGARGVRRPNGPRSSSFPTNPRAQRTRAT